MPVETLSIQFTTTLWFDDVPGKFLDRVLVVARRLLLMSSSAMPASACARCRAPFWIFRAGRQQFTDSGARVPDRDWELKLWHPAVFV